MVKINDKVVATQSNIHKAGQENRRVIITCIIAVILSAMACNSNPHFGILTTPDYDPTIVILVEIPEKTIENSEQTSPNNSASIQEPAGESQSSEEVANNVGINEYSVSAQDFNCICQVDGNVNVELRVNGDQLEVIDTSGGVQVYDKIGENSYKRSWMGYYIDTTGGKETKVDEEKSVIIILTPTGYVMEHYQGSEGSPCCIHTFTKEN